MGERLICRIIGRDTGIIRYGLNVSVRIILVFRCPSSYYLADRIQLIVRQNLEDRPVTVCHRLELFKLSIRACLLALENIAVPSDVPGVVVT